MLIRLHVENYIQSHTSETQSKYYLSEVHVILTNIKLLEVSFFRVSHCSICTSDTNFQVTLWYILDTLEINGAQISCIFLALNCKIVFLYPVMFFLSWVTVFTYIEKRIEYKWSAINLRFVIESKWIIYDFKYIATCNKCLKIRKMILVA